MDWNLTLIISVAGLIVAIIGVVFAVAGKNIIEMFQSGTVDIFLTLSDGLVNIPGLKFGLLHVQNGTTNDSKDIINKDHWFKTAKSMDLKRLKTSLRFKKNLGLQFKCFVEYKGIKYDQLKILLEKNGYKFVSKGSTGYRAYFILPAIKTVEATNPSDHSKPFINNYIYPK